MCYSAQVRQNIHELARRYGADIAYDLFAQLFRRRLEGEDIKATRALEDSFAEPVRRLAERDHTHGAYRALQWQQIGEVFARFERRQRDSVEGGPPGKDILLARGNA